jgi:hypothetical protein
MDFKGSRCVADLDLKITFYAQRYSDGFTPEVLFLVSNAARAESVNRALTEWSAQRPSRWKPPRALTLADAVREILTALGQWSSELGPAPNINAASGGSLTARDIKLLTDFYNDAVGTLKSVRAVARGKNEMPPPYPAGSDDVRKLLEQLWKNVRYRARG